MGNQALKEWNLLKLVEYKCELPLKSKLNQTQSSPLVQSTPEGEKDKPDVKRKPSAPTFSAPSAPSALKLISNLWQVGEIIDLLNKLNDGRLLAKARSHSPQFDRSIYRWEMLRFRYYLKWLERQGIVAIQEASKELGEETATIPKNELPKALTIENVKELSDYEYPKFSDIEPLRKEISQITLPPLGVPLSIFFATIILEFGLFFSIVYFRTYQREARLSESFPGPGTLFSVFNRTLTYRIIFKFMISFPAVASALLAFCTINIFPYYYVLLNFILAILICCFSFRIAQDF
jgi:hypothetical protein